eukprot:TRINITY_DN18527_c0_g1_i1.p1 TRINITY_DN18527_c0_g1~~TRINITY_DN18527_c0_g1_i1.p1  ORF type:complete len:1079 (+),score=273.61 TRINITY_DN18527_c0_g1_i1:59-3295(+)
MQRAALMAVLLLSVAAGHAHARRHEEPDVHSTSNLHLPVLSLVLVAVFGTAVLGAFAKGCCGRGRLGVMLGCAMAAGLFFVGILSWWMTYLTAIAQVQEDAERLVIATSQTLADHVTTDFSNGVQMCRLLSAAVSMDRFDLHNIYPDAQLTLAMLVSAHVQRDHHDVYYGIPGDGNITSIHGPAYIGVSATSTDNVYEIWQTPEYNAAESADFVECEAYDRGGLTDVTRERNAYTAPFGRTTPECTAYATAGGCGSDASRDFQCQQSCAGRTPAGGGAPLPSRSPRFCAHYPGDARTTLAFSAEFTPSSDADLGPAATEGTAVYGPLPNGLPMLFNPTLRPWWHVSTTPMFTDPYLYINGEVGLTVSSAAYDDAGALAGVAAVDFSVGDFFAYLEGIAEKTSKNAVVFLAARVGTLMGTSLTAAELEADTGVPRGMLLSVLDLSGQPHSLLGETFDTVIDDDGNRTAGFAALFRRRVFIVKRDRLYRSVPIKLSENVATPAVVVLTLPLSDMLGSTDDASFLSLVFTIIVSLAASAVLYVVVARLLAPLKELERGMEAAAEMQFKDGERPAPSRVTEVAGMQASFACMVTRLCKFREFMPQNLLLLSNVAGSVDDDRSSDDDCSGPDDDASETGSIGLVAGSVSSTPASSVNEPALPASTRRVWNRPLPLDCDASSGGLTPVQNPLTPVQVRTPSLRATSVAVVKMSSPPTGDVPETTPPYPTRLSDERFNLNVVMRRISMMVISVKDCQVEVRRTVNTGVAIRKHAMLLSKLLAVSRENKGVCDFAGDTVTIAFNAAKRTGTHQSRCVHCSVAAHKQNESGFRIHIGASTGSSYVGNMGCTGMKKFNIMGKVQDLAANYSSLAAAWNLTVVVADHTLKDIRNEYDARALYATVERGVKLTVLSEVLGAYNASNEEWMYQLEAVEKSPYRIIERAVRQVFCGSVAEARSLLGDAGAGLSAAEVSEYRKGMKFVDPNGPDLEGHLKHLVSWVALLHASGVDRLAPLDLSLSSVDTAAHEYVAGADPVTNATAPAMALDSVSSSSLEPTKRPHPLDGASMSSAASSMAAPALQPPALNTQ